MVRGLCCTCRVHALTTRAALSRVELDGDTVVLLVGPPYPRWGSPGLRAGDIYRVASAYALSYLYGDHLVVLDTECPAHGRMAEIGLLEVAYGFPHNVQAYLMDPGPEVVPRNAHTLAKSRTAALVEGAATFEHEAPVLQNFMAGTTRIVSWGVKADRAALQHEMRLAGEPHPPLHWIDAQAHWTSIKQAKKFGALQVAYNDVIGEWRQASHNGADYALDDAVRAYEVLAYVALVKYLRGARPEDMDTTPSRLGTDWRPTASAVEPQARRYPLPGPYNLPTPLKPRYSRWRDSVGSPLPFGVPQDDDREAWRAFHESLRERNENCGFARRLRLPLAVRVEDREPGAVPVLPRADNVIGVPGFTSHKRKGTESRGA